MPDLEGRYNTLSFTPTRKEVVGISLFTEEINGKVQTTIYQRYGGGPPDHGGRVFARSVDPGEEHHDETVQSWIDGADDVRDFRPGPIRNAKSARLLLSGAVGAVRGTTRHGDLTAASIAETLAHALTEQEKEIVRSSLGDAPAEAPPIDAGSEWEDEDGPAFTVQNVWIDEDGTAQVQIREEPQGDSWEDRTLSVSAQDMRRRAASGEIRRVD